MGRFARQMLTGVVVVTFVVATLTLTTRIQAAPGFQASGGSAPPVGRLGATTVWDAESGRMLVFGGFAVPTSGDPRSWDPSAFFPNDLWAYNPLTGWEQIVLPNAPGSPPSRVAHSAVWDASSNRLLVFGGLTPSFFGPGGSDPTANFLNDLWAFSSLGGWQQLSASGAAGAPRPRAGHSATWDPQGNRMLVFGGLVLPRNLPPPPRSNPRPEPPSTPQPRPTRTPTPVGQATPTPRPAVSPTPRQPEPRDPESEVAMLRSLFPNDVWQYGDLTGWQQVTANTVPEVDLSVGFLESDARTLWQGTADTLPFWRE